MHKNITPGNPNDKREGWKIDVDDRIVAACKELARAVQEITIAATNLQREIEANERGLSTTQEFYRRNSEWAKGLISSAKKITEASIGFV